MKKKKVYEERRQIIRGETQKLLKASHIREIQYPEWLANVILVQKTNGRWGMCVEFTNLNKACPKDSYLLPIIDSLVDNASGCRLLSFLDAFSIRSACTPEMRARPPSWPSSLAIATTSCLSVSRMVVSPIRGRWTRSLPNDWAKCTSVCGRYGRHL